MSPGGDTTLLKGVYRKLCSPRNAGNTEKHRETQQYTSININKTSGVTIILPPPANIRYGLTVLIHNSGHFAPPYRFGPLSPPGLPMASYATRQNVWFAARKVVVRSSLVRFPAVPLSRNNAGQVEYGWTDPDSA